MERRKATEHQLREDYELLREQLPDLLFEVLKDSELEDGLEHDLVFRPDMKTARYRRGADEIHLGTDNRKMENLRVAWIGLPGRIIELPRLDFLGTGSREGVRLSLKFLQLVSVIFFRSKKYSIPVENSGPLQNPAGKPPYFSLL